MMTRLATIGFASALAFAAGCADSEGTSKPGDGGDGSGSQEQPPEPTKEMDAQGMYRVNSTFDIATNMPGASGSFVNGLIEATDDQDDPMSWLVDQILATMDDGPVKSVLSTAKVFVIGYLNDRVTSLAPELVNTIKAVGERMEELTKHFGVNEILDVTKTSIDSSLVATTTADSVRWTIAGTTTDYKFTDYNIDNVVVHDIQISLDTVQAKMNIGEHDLPLPWGKIVRLGLDVAVIPSIDPTATSMTDLLDNVVDCQAVGTAINNAVNFGGSALWAGACLAGLGLAADKVYDQIADTDSTLGMHLVGQSRYQDNDNDYRIDEMKFGNWTGSMTMDPDTAQLAQPAAYVGKRMMGTP